MAEPKHDTLRHVEIPEGVEIHLRIAGPVVRGLAWLIDALIIFGLIILAFMLTGLSAMVLGVAAAGLLYLMMFAILTFYWVIFEVFFGGATPGKRSMGIYVTKPSGEPVGLQESLLRNLLRFADFLPLFYAFGLT
ncbi:MAG: RDD family protein, partial [Phycisphaeraceae bacterium]|nr:RDD family protein [Phycisphaeraceae bacterium]